MERWKKEHIAKSKKEKYSCCNSIVGREVGLEKQVLKCFKRGYQIKINDRWLFNAFTWFLLFTWIFFYASQIQRWKEIEKKAEGR